MDLLCTLHVLHIESCASDCTRPATSSHRYIHAEIAEPWHIPMDDPRLLAGAPFFVIRRYEINLGVVGEHSTPCPFGTFPGWILTNSVVRTSDHTIECNNTALFSEPIYFENNLPHALHSTAYLLTLPRTSISPRWIGVHLRLRAKLVPIFSQNPATLVFWYWDRCLACAVNNSQALSTNRLELPSMPR